MEKEKISFHRDEKPESIITENVFGQVNKWVTELLTEHYGMQAWRCAQAKRTFRLPEGKGTCEIHISHCTLLLIWVARVNHGEWDEQGAPVARMKKKNWITLDMKIQRGRHLKDLHVGGNIII
jgi:hypothetical protein